MKEQATEARVLHRNSAGRAAAEQSSKKALRFVDPGQVYASVMHSCRHPQRGSRAIPGLAPKDCDSRSALSTAARAAPANAAGVSAREASDDLGKLPLPRRRRQAGWNVAEGSGPIGARAVPLAVYRTWRTSCATVFALKGRSVCSSAAKRKVRGRRKTSEASPYSGGG